MSCNCLPVYHHMWYSELHVHMPTALPGQVFSPVLSPPIPSLFSRSKMPSQWLHDVGSNWREEERSLPSRPKAVVQATKTTLHLLQWHELWSCNISHSLPLCTPGFWMVRKFFFFAVLASERSYNILYVSTLHTCYLLVEVGHKVLWAVLSQSQRDFEVQSQKLVRLDQINFQKAKHKLNFNFL